MNTFVVDCTFFWSCVTEKGYQRIALSCDLELPFAPHVGMCIQIADEIPSPKITEVLWEHAEQKFSIGGRVRLKDWDSKLFESLLDDIRQAGDGYDPTLYDDNWIYAK